MGTFYFGFYNLSSFLTLISVVRSCLGDSDSMEISDEVGAVGGGRNLNSADLAADIEAERRSGGFWKARDYSSRRV